MRINVIKSAASIWLGSAMMLAGFTMSAQAQVGPAYQGDYRQVCTNTRYGNLTMRSGPSTGYRAKTRIPNRTQIQVLDSVVGNDGFEWYKIRYGKYTGWVRYDYVCD